MEDVMACAALGLYDDDSGDDDGNIMGMDPLMMGVMSGNPMMMMRGLGMMPRRSRPGEDWVDPDDENPKEAKGGSDARVGERRGRDSEDGAGSDEDAPAAKRRRTEAVPEERKDWCYVCGVECQPKNRDAHDKGKKHQRALKAGGAKKEPQHQQRKAAASSKPPATPAKPTLPRKVELTADAPAPLYAKEEGDYGMTRGREGLKPGQEGYLEMRKDSDIPTKASPHVRLVKNYMGSKGDKALIQYCAGPNLAHVIGGNGADLVALARKSPNIEVIASMDSCTLFELASLIQLLPRLKYLDPRDTSAGRLCAGESEEAWNKINKLAPKKLLIDL